MNIICTQENIQKQIHSLERVIVKQSNLPILSNILFEVEDGRVKLSATNLEVGVTGYMGAKIIEEGSVALPARVIGNFINNIPSHEVIEISTKDQQVTLSSGTHTLSVFTASAKDFPIIPRGEFTKRVSLPAQGLKNALQGVLYAVSANPIRPELTGVLFAQKESTLYIVATDSFRLVEEKIALSESETLFLEEVIIPVTTLQELIRVIDDTTEEVTLSFENNQVFIQVNDIEITSRLINGKFPDYSQIIPKDFANIAQFQKEDLQRALKIASGITGYAGGEVALICDKGASSISIVSRSVDVGENVSSIVAEWLSEGVPVTLYLQAKFLQDYLSNTSDSEVLLSYNSEAAPILLSGVKTKEQTFSLIMPIRK